MKPAAPFSKLWAYAWAEVGSGPFFSFGQLRVVYWDRTFLRELRELIDRYVVKQMRTVHSNSLQKRINTEDVAVAVARFDHCGNLAQGRIPIGLSVSLYDGLIPSHSNNKIET